MNNENISNPILTNCTFSGNSASWGDGGGMANNNSSPTLTNCTFSGNSPCWRGGGMNNENNSDPNIINCTFSGNEAYGLTMNGGGMFNDESSPTVTNCIFWGDTPLEILGGTPVVTYSDVQGGWPGTGNIDEDPCFVESGFWDMNGVWVDGDYHLLPTSPCIDAANDANVYTDIEGNIRPFDFPGVDNNGELPDFDMGAYEATAQKANLWIFPKVIQRYGRLRKIVAWVRLPEGITRDQIDRDSKLMLYPGGSKEGIEATFQLVFQRRRCRPPRTSVVAFFDKGELMEVVPDNGWVELQAVGQFVDTGQYFYGTDTIRIRGWQWPWWRLL